MRTLRVQLEKKDERGWKCAVMSDDMPWPWGAVSWWSPTARDAYYATYHMARAGFRRWTEIRK